MTDLISVLVLTYAVGGVAIESEMPMADAQCRAAAAAVGRAIGGPRRIRPFVELLDGRRVPVTAVRCLAACVPSEPVVLTVLGEW